MNRRPVLVAGAVFLFVATACGGGGSASETTVPPATSAPILETSTTPAPATSEQVTTTTELATTTTAAPDAAPPELAGGPWGTDLDTGDPAFDRVFLTLDGNQYIVNRGPNTVPGKISVDGDQIRFFGTERIHCDGEGVYKWSIEDETLTFTALEPLDPCSNRRQVLDGVSFTR